MLLFSTVTVRVCLVVSALVLKFVSACARIKLCSSTVGSVQVIVPMAVTLDIILLPELSCLTRGKSGRSTAALLGGTFSMVVLFTVPLTFFFFFVSSGFIPFFFKMKCSNTVVPVGVYSFLVLIDGVSCFTSIRVLTVCSFRGRFLLSAVTNVLFGVIKGFYLVSACNTVNTSVTSLVKRLTIAFISFCFICQGNLCGLE